MDYLFLAILVMVLLGIHYFFVKLITPHVSGATIAFLCSLLTIPTVVAYLYFLGIPFVPEQRIFLGYSLLAGVLMAFGILSLYMAIHRGPVSTVMPIYSLNAMVTALLGIIVLNEAISVEKVAGLILAMIAIVLLSR